MARCLHHNGSTALLFVAHGPALNRSSLFTAARQESKQSKLLIVHLKRKLDWSCGWSQVLKCNYISVAGTKYYLK